MQAHSWMIYPTPYSATGMFAETTATQLPFKGPSPKDIEHDHSVKVIEAAPQDAIFTPTGVEKDNFTLFGAFGLAFSVINSWVVLVVGLGAGLVAGGPSARKETV